MKLKQVFIDFKARCCGKKTHHDTYLPQIKQIMTYNMDPITVVDWLSKAVTTWHLQQAFNYHTSINTSIASINTSLTVLLTYNQARQIEYGSNI